MTTATALLRERSEAAGRRTVSAAVYQAASAGIAAYARGGNAFDAALSACFVETVALPMKCGLAGDVIALYRQAGGPVQAMVSVGGAPTALAHGRTLEPLGPASVGVPGAPAGYAALLDMASLGVDTLIQPALNAATFGVPWTRTGLSYLAESRELLQRWSPDCPYLQGDPRAGDTFRLPGLGEWLRAFAREGAALFHGDLGRRVVDEVQRRGGFLTLADLRTHPARRCEPVTATLGESTLYATPGPTQGPQLLDVMRRLAAQGAREPAAHGTERPSALVDIVRDVRAQARRQSRGANDDGTSVVTAADDAGNVVVIVHSNSFPRFGSGVVLPDGLVLNNRPGRGFDPQAEPGSPGHARSGAVPPTTLHAWALCQAGNAFWGATPGGINQLVWNSQALAGLLRGAAPGEVLLQPRWSLTPSGGLLAEAGLARDGALSGADGQPAFGARSVQQIVCIADGMPTRAFADPRAGGIALALA